MVGRRTGNMWKRETIGGSPKRPPRLSLGRQGQGPPPPPIHSLPGVKRRKKGRRGVRRRRRRKERSGGQKLPRRRRRWKRRRKRKRPRLGGRRRRKEERLRRRKLKLRMPELSQSALRVSFDGKCNCLCFCHFMVESFTDLSFICTSGGGISSPPPMPPQADVCTPPSNLPHTTAKGQGGQEAVQPLVLLASAAATSLPLPSSFPLPYTQPLPTDLPVSSSGVVGDLSDGMNDREREKVPHANKEGEGEKEGREMEIPSRWSNKHSVPFFAQKSGKEESTLLPAQ